MITRFHLHLIALLIVAAGSLHAQQAEKSSVLPPEGRRGIRVLWHNVENLFHPADDTLTEADNEFISGGIRGWSYSRYRKKLTALAKVVIAAGSGDPPGIVGFCEIEDRKVMEDLASHPILEPYGYRAIHTESSDHRGMDVACLYRPARLEVVRWSAIPPVIKDTRDILHLQIGWGRGDTLDLFLVHLISKYRGMGVSARMRREQALQLSRLLAEAACSAPLDPPKDPPREPPEEPPEESPAEPPAEPPEEPPAEPPEESPAEPPEESPAEPPPNRSVRLVILAGDFNDPPGSYALEPLLQFPQKGDSVICLPPSGSGCSYKYRGEWSGIDRFFIYGTGERYTVSSGVLALPALMEADEQFGGVKPFRTFEGYTYHGGFSDHLPVWLDISRRSLLFSAPFLR